MSASTLLTDLPNKVSLPPRLWPLRELRGQLGLSIVEEEERSYAKRQMHQGYSRVLRPHYMDDSGQVYYTMINPGGGYFGGDDYRIDLQVGENASLLLTDQSATTVYKTPDNYCSQELNVLLEPGAVLEYVPSQLILYRNATFHQYLRVDMAPTASLLLTEIITPGWSPDQGLFQYDEVRLRTAVNVNGAPALLDNLLVRPGRGSLNQDPLLFLEDKTHLGTLTAVDRRIDTHVVLRIREILRAQAEKARTPLQWAATCTDGPGLSVRVLGMHTDDIKPLLHAVINYLRREWRKQEPLVLRKY